jgi:hypothetical protein
MWLPTLSSAMRCRNEGGGVKPVPRRVVRPRFGDLEAATHPHSFVPSGEYVGSRVEICDLCGLSFPSPLHTGRREARQPRTGRN